MEQANGAGSEQMQRWNGPAGEAWVALQTVLDGIFHPFETLLCDIAADLQATRVLDVGCGTGATTRAIARRLGAGSSVAGIDISGPMLDVARACADAQGVPARFTLADVQSHAFDDADIDLIVSRFGVMFFDDAPRAFANLCGAMRPGGRLRAIAWRSAAENPFMTTAERAAGPMLPDLPPRRADGPGQFAFGDPDRVRTLLADSGWQQIQLQPLDVVCRFPEAGLVPYLSRLGPVGTALGQVGEATRARIIDITRAAFEPFVHNGEVRFDAACWMVCAQAPGG